MAFNVITTINLDMTHPNATIVNAVQYDNSGRVIRANLLNNGEPWPVPSGVYPVIRYQKSDRIGGFYDVDENNAYAINFENNRQTINITLALQMLTTVGNVNVQINFYNTTGVRVTSFAFRIRVQQSVVPDDKIVSSEYYNALTKTLATVVQAGNIEELATAAQNAATAAQNAATTARDEVIGTVPAAVNSWLSANISNPSNPPLDRSLTVAQAAAPADLVGINKTDIYNNGCILYPFFDEKNVFTEDGKYVTNTGAIGNNANYISSMLIPVRENDSFTYQNLWGNANIVSVVSFYDKNRTFLSGSQIIATGNVQTGVATAPQDGYIRFSVVKSYLTNNQCHVFPAVFKNVYGKLGRSIYTIGHTLLTEGMVCDCIGDSITNQGNVASADRWRERLKVLLRFSEVVNHGIDGSTVSETNNGMCTDARINALRTDAHVYIVLGGMNDWGANVPIGEQTYNNENTRTFFGACNVLFRKLIAKAGTNRIVAFGTLFGYAPNRDVFTDKTGFKNNQGLTSLDYSAAMMKSAEMNSIEHYNLGANVQINFTNRSINYITEPTGFSIHPNATGSWRMAQYMAKFIGAD